MRFYYALRSVAIALIALAGHAVTIVGPLIAAPLIYLIRDAPATFWPSVAPVRPIACRIVSHLKPEYRESLRTAGLSLRAA